ncbi:hypothetical protein [Corallincola spongiicola]|uniref:Uncharacterized protein n=1 Tax=Corallincola spongiicola TaxID=2520508 RepID=A0ABY1WLA9_9GAMM|nr:hypothetical protein [Corallincola spongiicola]TAA41707.1 hypothetical protein EXY25_15810 [Corallincola spongiicola]
MPLVVRIILIVITISAALAVGTPVLMNYADQKASSASSQADLQWIADQMNAKLPKMVGENMSFDQVAVRPDGFQFIYTLVDYAAEEIDTAHYQTVVEEHFVSSYCTAPQMRVFYEQGINVLATYKGKNGGILANVAVNRSACVSS